MLRVSSLVPLGLLSLPLIMRNSGNNVDGEQNFAAKLTISSSTSILVLEEIEHLFDDLTCASNSIAFSIPSFGDTSVLEKLLALKDGHIITSHPGCNAENERQAYRLVAHKSLRLVHSDN